MSFPTPTSPLFLHLFVDSTSTLLGGSNATTFFQLCNDSCINTFTMYQIPTITNPSNQANLRNFICEAKSNQGICTVGGVINPYNWSPAPQGTSYIQNIINYNDTYTQNDCEKIDYLTIESEFWQVENTTLNPQILTVSTISIPQNTSIGTVTGSMAGISVGRIIKIQTPSGYVYRQIILVVGQQITLDRVFDTTTSYTNLSFIIIDNSTYFGIDFETLLYRIKNFIRPMAIANNLLPLEIYLGVQDINSFNITNDQYRRLIPFVDRILVSPDFDQNNYPLYNDSSGQIPLRNVLSACSQTRQGTISISLNSNQLNGTGTQFTSDLAPNGRIVTNSNVIFTIDTIISDTQATIIGTSSANTVSETYSTYFDYMPIQKIVPTPNPFATPLRRSWQSTNPPKSYVDTYRFHTQTGYSIPPSNNQNNNNVPKAFNDETNTNIQNSVNAVGLSIFSRTGFETLTVAPSPISCFNCCYSYQTFDSCFFSASTTSNCLVATFTNPSCNGVCNGTISASTTYGVAPFIYSITGITTNYTDQNSNGFFSNLCEDSYILCVTDALTATTCYYQNINLVNTFYGNINAFLNGFCVTITGGTQPYHVYLDGIELSWDYNNTTNCFPSNCSTQSIITVTDSSS
jgi:hypothetical protein